MNKKQYNAVIRECLSTSCYHCGYSTQCTSLNDSGIYVSHVKFFSTLTPEEKERVARCPFTREDRLVDLAEKAIKIEVKK